MISRHMIDQHMIDQPDPFKLSPSMERANRITGYKVFAVIAAVNVVSWVARFCFGIGA